MAVFAYMSFVNPWQTAINTLAQMEQGPRIVISFSLQTSFTYWPQQTHRIQTYLAMPDSFRTLNAYEVSQDSKGVHIKPIRYGFPIFMAFYGFWIVGSFWYFYRHRHRNERP